MIKNIINSFNSGFFRTLGRLCLYILLGYILLSFYSPSDIKIKLPLSLGFTNVYASENSFNLYTFEEESYTDLPIDYINQNTQFYSSTGYNSFNRLNVYNCTSSSSCTGSISSYYTTGGVVFSHTMQNYGFDFAHDSNIVIGNNHLVSYQYTFCTENYIGNISNRIWVNTGIGSGRGNQVSLLRTDYYALNNITWYNHIIGDVSSNCYTVYNLFVSPASSSLTLKTNLTSSQYSQKYINLIGYKIDDLGPTDYLTNSQLNSAISNAGLATASSVSQVQSSVSQVQQEIDGVNSSIEEQTQQQQENHEETINTITDDTVNPNIYDFGDLPVSSNTPITDLLLLPLNLINSLLTSLNNSCTTYQLPFFNNTTLNLPCINISNYLGADLWHIIDLCIVFYMVYNIFMLFISIFDDITSLKDGFSSLYVPRHAGHTRVSRANMEGLY